MVYRKGTPEYETWIASERGIKWKKSTGHPKGVPLSLDHRRSISLSQIGKSHPHKEHSDETRMKISAGLRKSYSNGTRVGFAGNGFKGRKHTSHARAKIRVARARQVGENHPNWNGGSSFYPYCPLFNDEYKRRIRNAFKNRCYLCGSEPNGKELHVHHIHYDKEAGCNGRGLECIPLCDKHHKMTYPLGRRSWWEKYFEQRLWNIYGWKLDGEAI